MSCRVMVKNQVIPAVGIYVQSVTIVGIFLCESGNDRIIISYPEVILPCQRVILLSRITETVMYLFFTVYGISECIIFIMVKYLRLYVLLWEFSAFLVLTIDDMGDTSLLIRYIVIGVLCPFDVGIKRCYDCMD